MGILAENEPLVVDKLCKVLGEDGSKEIFLKPAFSDKYFDSPFPAHCTLEVSPTQRES